MLLQRHYHLVIIPVVVPLIATIFALQIEDHLPKGNISLVYLSAILLVAVRTNMKTALLCAVTSFFTYNYFFTEPKYSLIMIHEEDILTVGFFMLMAAITGHQAARVREQYSTVQARERFMRVQFEMSEDLAVAIDNETIYKKLTDAITKITGLRCAVVKLTDKFTILFGGLDNAYLCDAYNHYISRFKNTLAIEDSLFCQHGYCFSVNELSKSDGILVLAELDKDKKKSSEYMISVNALVQQAVLAIARMKLSEDLQKERLEKEQELLRSALLSSVSHDLRTPLASVLGATTSLMELNDSLTEQQKNELLEAILNETKRLDRYIQNLLDMTRLGRGDLKLDRDWVAWEDILNVVLKRAKPLLSTQRFVTKSDNDIPLIYVHPALIEQAIYNVIENSIKFSPENSTIDITAHLSQDKLIIDICDHGPGIPDAEKKLVFDMFHTVGRGDRYPSGTGLGLAICKGMIGAHGGDVTVNDAPDHKGTLVTISLPISMADAEKGIES